MLLAMHHHHHHHQQHRPACLPLRRRPTWFLVAVVCLGLAASLAGRPILAFSTTVVVSHSSARAHHWKTDDGWQLQALRTNFVMPLLDMIDEQQDVTNDNSNEDDDDRPAVLIPLPSANLPDQLSTPFLYGMQMERPLHKLLVEEAISMAAKENWKSPHGGGAGGGGGAVKDDGDDDKDEIEMVLPILQTDLKQARRPMYGHLIWKNRNSESLVGAIGCTTEILVNAPTTQVLTSLSSSQLLAEELANEDTDGSTSAGATAPPSETPPSTILGRGGFRFVVKEVVKTIPYPVAIVDEFQDDSNDDDSDMFATVSGSDKNDDEENNDDDLAGLDTPQLIQQIMRGVQSIISQRLDEAVAKTRLSPLEKSILEDSGLMGDSGINMAEVELAHAEEMVAVWEVFQLSLVDDIAPQDRRFAVAVMAAELADLDNSVRQQVLLTRNGVERLKIVLRAIRREAGMVQARKMAEKITEAVDEDEKDLKVGAPQLPLWAKQIRKGTRVQYFWNDEFGWCTGEVIDDPVTIVDEIILTIRFDDGETHKLPLVADDKIRWRPG